MRYLFLLIIFLYINAAHASTPDLYTVNHIHINSGGDNATLARTMAIEQGEEEAFFILLKRLTPSFTHHALPKEVLAEDIANMVRRMHVSEEKVTSKHYSATLSISFNPILIQKILEDTGLSYINSPSPPTVIVPMFYNEEGTLLSNDNPWMQTWRHIKQDGGLVHYIIPTSSDVMVNENITDNFTFGDNTLPLDQNLDLDNNHYQQQRLEKFIKKHHANQVIFVIAHHKSSFDSHKLLLDVQLKRYEKDDNSIVGLSYHGNRGESLDDVITFATHDINQNLENEWKYEFSSKQSKRQKIAITIPIKNLTHWHTVKNRLDHLETLDNIRIKTLSVETANVEFSFQTNFDNLISLLAYEGFYLEQQPYALLLKDYDDAPTTFKQQYHMRTFYHGS